MESRMTAKHDDHIFTVVDSILSEEVPMVNIEPYNAWLINRFVSTYADAALRVFEVARRPQMPVAWQYDYLFNSITKKRNPKYNMGGKKTRQEFIPHIQKYFSCSTRMADEYSHILSEEQMAQIYRDVNGTKK
jgi:hypothetical protein